MKQLIRTGLGLLTLLLGVGSSPAAIIDTGVSIKDGNGTYGPFFLYPDFTYDRQSQFYCEIGDGKGYTEEVIIYDADFNYVKSLTAPTFPILTASYSYQPALKGPKDVTVSNVDERWMQSLTSIEEAQEYLGSDWVKVQEGDEIKFLYNGEDEWNQKNYYYAFDAYGKKYPTTYYVVRDSDPDSSWAYDLVLVDVRYTYTEYGFLGYGVAEERTDTHKSDPYSLYTQTYYSRDLSSVLVSQTLFNTDEAYEWFFKTHKIVDYSIETENYKEYGQKIVETGFKAVSENGSTIASVEYPAGMKVYNSPDLYVSTEGRFIVVGLEDETGDRYSVVYKVDNGSSSIRQVGAPVKTGMKVSPTAPARGTTVNVTLPPTERNTRLSLVGADGRRVMQRTLETGATDAQIETSGLPAGIYVVVLEDAKGPRENCKIIIR